MDSRTTKEESLRALMVCGMAGDRAAYQEVLKELSRHLRAYFRRRLPSLPDEVEDLVQEALLGIHNQRHTYRSDQPFTAWVHAIARYKMIDMLRRRKHHDALNDPLNEDMELFASEDIEASNARRDITKLLKELPEQQRLPIQYVKLDGLSVIEAARLSGMSESAVKVGVHRGLKSLAAKLRLEL